jgi:hypothetical protein
MVEIDYNLVYLHKKSLKNNVKTYLCLDCVGNQTNLIGVHHQTHGLDNKCSKCKLPSLLSIVDYPDPEHVIIIV